MMKGWEVRKLGEIIKLEYGKPLPDAKRKKDGHYPVYGANGEKDRTDEYYFDRPSIIVGRKGSAGEINLTEKRFWPLDVTYFVVFNDKKYDLKFIYYQLSSLGLPKLAKGVKPGINRNEVYSLAIKVPPLPDQQRIAASLDEAFAAIAQAKDNVEKNLFNSRDLFDSYLQNVFADTSGWETKRLVEIVDFKGGGTPSKARPEFWIGNIPWVSPKDMKAEEIYDSLDHISPAALWNSSTTLIPQGSVLIVVRSGILARTVPIAIAMRNVTINQDMKALIPHKCIVSKFLYYILVANQNKLLAKANRGATVHRLPSENLENLWISFPLLSKQKDLVAKLDALSAETKKLEAIYQKQLAELEDLKKSILDKAFRGELTGGES